MRRQLAAQLVIIEIGMQIGQDRTGGFDAGDPTERVIDAEMARVRPIAQRVHNPDFGTGKRSNAGLRQPTQIGPPSPSTVMDWPACNRCSVTIGGYSLPTGASKQ